MDVPNDLLYTKEHEWIKLIDSKAMIGITDYAQEQLGDITFVELPSVGKSARQLEVICSIESVKAATDIYAPMSGVVSRVNEALEDSPELLNESPYEEGWIVEMEISDVSEKKELMDAKGYEEYLTQL